MFDPYHDAFFYFNNLFGIKYSCMGLILFFVILKYFYWRCENEYSDGRIQSRWKKLTNGERQSVIGVGATYILLLVSDLPFWRFLHSFDFLQEPAKLFLSMEPLISLVMVALAIGAFGIRGSQREYLNMLNATVRTLIFVSVASSLLVNQFVPWSWYNIICLLFVGGLLLWLKLLSLNKSETKTSSNMFDAVATYDELFPLRKTQADELCRIMSNPDSRGISICVTGPWGIGKTSLVEGACDQLRKLQNTSGNNIDNQTTDVVDGEVAHYEFIFIRALELDSLSSLFHYLFSRIREILKTRGAYVGLGSEYQRLIASAGGVISNTEWSTVLEKQLFTSEDDYRSQRNRLESLMEKALGKDKLIIIVDDIERCAPEKAREFLYFIKEIATMRCCISIFITDESYLPAPDSEKDSQAIFWDKFFNYHITVGVIASIDSIKYYEEEIKSVSVSNKYYPERPSKVYQDLLEDLQNRAESNGVISVFQKAFNQNQDKADSKAEENAKKRRDYLYSCITRLEGQLSLPRTTHKFCRVYYDTYETLMTFYKAIPTDELQQYFEFLQLPKLLFIWAYLCVCYPIEVEEIRKNRFHFYLALIWKNEYEPKRFLYKLMENILFKESIFTQEFTYQNQKQIRFLDTFLTCPQELPNIIDGFTTQEREWLADIKQDNQKAMEENWDKMIYTVIQQYPYLDGGCFYLKRLIHFSKMQVVAGKWILTDAFQVFDYNVVRVEFLFNQAEARIVPLVSLFADEFGDEAMLKGASEKLERTMQVYASIYLQSICLPIQHVLSYINPQGKLYDYSFITDNLENITDKITHYLQVVQQTAPWNDRMQGSLEGIDGLRVLLEEAGKLLQAQNLLDYPDIKNMYQCAEAAFQEVEALPRFLEQLHFSVNQSADQFTDLSMAVERMDRILQQPNEYTEQKIQQDFHALFNFVRSLEREAVSQKDLQQLHKIVSEYYDLHLNGQQEIILFFRAKLRRLESQCQK